MMKVAFFVTAAALATATLVIPAKAQDARMAQVDMQTGLHLDDPAHYNRDHRRPDPNAAVGISPGGITSGPRQSCRVVTTTTKRAMAAGSRAESASVTKRIALRTI